tara:strand:- start:130 stop:264 length:135 start_codon:yes stop_codon:yes gene_type:complete
MSGGEPEHAPRKTRNTGPRLPDIDQAFIDREAFPEWSIPDHHHY